MLLPLLLLVMALCTGTVIAQSDLPPFPGYLPAPGGYTYQQPGQAQQLIEPAEDGHYMIQEPGVVEYYDANSAGVTDFRIDLDEPRLNFSWTPAYPAPGPRQFER